MSRGSGTFLAGISAALAAASAVHLAGGLARQTALRAGSRLGAVGRLVDEVLGPLRRAGGEGRDATRRERRRLQAAFAAASMPIAFTVADPIPAICLTTAAGLLAPRALVWRRERYARRLGEGSSAAAVRIADSLASGHTTRAAIGAAATQLRGPIGRELCRVAADLELGETTNAALGNFRERAASRRVDLLVSAVLLQHRSGGNLAALLRDVAAALDDQERLEAEARAETAQARFTSTVVLVMPFCLLALYELLSPGTVGRVLGSGLGASLVGAAAVLQAAGALMVRRLARVHP